MKISKTDIQREGFAVLHGKWGGNRGCIVGLNGKRTSKGAIGQSHLRGTSIGFYSYPNPTLKNNIPDSRFYKYDAIIRRRAIDCAPAGMNMVYKTSGSLEQSVTKKKYIKKILQIKELLAAGEIYQMTYAIRFRKKFEGSPYALFLKLTEANPADFAAYINCGKFHIISSSPERLFKVEGDKIITQPIKGTAPKDSEVRSQNSVPLSGRILNPPQKKKYTDKNLIKLINSKKERAELDMITDLERNDVGKICEYGTLKLTKERELLELKNIWHTYSQVEGKLESGLQTNDIISAMFPGGSITGCPKKRAMEYIEKLEGMPRNIFTGSIGYIHSEAGPQRSGSTAKRVNNRKMDFNICIRTALVRNGYIEYWAGGGIVADSDPEKEYDECLLKAERFLSII